MLNKRCPMMVGDESIPLCHQVEIGMAASSSRLHRVGTISVWAGASVHHGGRNEA